MTNDEIRKKFSIYLVVQRRLSRKTYDVYYNIIDDFLTYVNENNLDLATMDVKEIEEFAASRNVDTRTVAKYFSSLRCFFRFLSQEQVRPDNPTDLFTTIKVRNTLPEVHSLEDIEKLFAIIENGNDIYAIRDSAIYELIYSSALRVSELVNLKIGDYYPEENLVRIVSSKRGKTRIVPVGSKAIQKIDEYLLSSRPKLQNANISDALFLSRFGRPLTRLEVWKRLDEYGERLGTHFTVHSLRHSFATHMLQNGASIVAIRDLLGHSDLRTTEVYTHLSNEDLRASFFKYKK